MTGPELTDHLETLGWSRRELARRIGVDEIVVRRWETVPDDLARWLRRAARWMQRSPVPRVRRSRASDPVLKD